MNFKNKFRVGLAICVLIAGAYFAKPIVAGIGDVVAYFNEAGTEVFSIDQDGKCTVTSFETSTVDINGGAIDGTAIGASSASTGAFTTLTASGVTSITDDTEASDTATASLKTLGGLAVQKKVFVGDEANFQNNAAAVTFGNVLTDADVVLAFDAVTAQGSITYMEDEDRFDFDNDVDMIGDLTVATVTSDAGVSGVDGDFSGDIYLDTTKKLILADDADDHTYIKESAADVLTVTVGGVDAIVITESTTISGSLPGAWDVVGAFTAGTVTSDATVNAASTMSTGANSGTSGQINFIASDNDQGNIVINTSDNLTFSGFGGGVDVDGDFTAGTMTSDAGVSGTTVTASTGFILGDGDYIGVTDNEVIKFNTAGTIKAEGADFYVGGTAADNVVPSFMIVGDADSDGAAATTSDTLTVVLTANATPTSATWGFTSTQSAGYTFDKNVSVNSDKVVVSEETNLQAIMHGNVTVTTSSYDGTATITYGNTFTATPTVVVTVAEALNSGYDSIVNVEDIGTDTCIVRLIDCVDDDSSIVVNYIVMGDE